MIDPEPGAAIAGAIAAIDAALAPEPVSAAGVQSPPPAPPADWVTRVERLAAEHELPPLLQPPGDAELLSGRWHLWPWTLGADVAALLQWAAHLDHPEIVGWTTARGSLVVTGQLDGVPTALVGHPGRPLSAYPGVPLGPAELRAAAGAESQVISGFPPDPAAATLPLPTTSTP